MNVNSGWISEAVLTRKIYPGEIKLTIPWLINQRDKLDYILGQGFSNQRACESPVVTVKMQISIP